MLNLILILLGLRQPTVDTALKGLMIAEKQLKTAAAVATKKADAQVAVVTRANDAYAKKTAKLGARTNRVVGQAAVKKQLALSEAARATRVSAKIADLTA